MLTSGVTFEMSNGDRLSIVPRSGKCKISNGAYEIEYDPSSKNYLVKALDVAASKVVVSRVVDGEFDISAATGGEKKTDEVGIMRTCNTCHGRACCVTNTCGRCADDCAWVCD